MILPIEYFVRHKVFRKFFRTPSNLLVIDQKSFRNLWFTFDRKNGQIEMKRYQMHETDPDTHLPPCDVIKCKDDEIDQHIFEHPGKVSREYLSVLRYAERYILPNMNDYSHPMAKEIYEDMFDNMFNTVVHRQQKICHLWYHYCRSAGLSTHMNDYIGRSGFDQRHDIYTMYENEFMNVYPKQMCPHWMEWRDAILVGENNKVATELVFASLYND